MICKAWKDSKSEMKIADTLTYLSSCESSFVQRRISNIIGQVNICPCLEGRVWWHTCYICSYSKSPCFEEKKHYLEQLLNYIFVSKIAGQVKRCPSQVRFTFPWKKIGHNELNQPTAGTYIFPIYTNHRPLQLILSCISSLILDRRSLWTPGRSPFRAYRRNCSSGSSSSIDPCIETPPKKEKEKEWRN